MPDKSDVRYLCVTGDPCWPYGTHPTTDDGAATCTVCFSETNCCLRRNMIKVKNCNSYELQESCGCIRYCGNAGAGKLIRDR